MSGFRSDNEAYRTAYRVGYKEGYLIGRLKVLLNVCTDMIRFHVIDNYEELFAWHEISEELIAHMMDYLPVRKGEWRYLTDTEKREKEDEINLKMKKAFKLLAIEIYMMKKHVDVYEAMEKTNLPVENYEEFAQLMSNRETDRNKRRKFH